MRRTFATAGLLLSTSVSIAACSRGEPAVKTGGSATQVDATPSTSQTSGDTIVRGTITAVSDSTLTLSAPGGEVRIALVQPVRTYTRHRADLSLVTDNAFVGITSVAQPDGSQRATEIHVFPEDLRGLGEGSRPMSAPAGSVRSTMTNGSVSPSRMTNRAARMTNGAARMTNGTSRGAGGGTITVTYNGGSQVITVPPDVPVTALEPTTAKLAPGTSVVVAGTREADGTIRTSRVMLSSATKPTREK